MIILSIIFWNIDYFHSHVPHRKCILKNFPFPRKTNIGTDFLNVNKYFNWAMRTSLITQLVKNPPATQETLALFLGWEELLEKGKAIPPILWPREFHGLYSPWCLKESDMTGHKWVTLNIYIYIYIYIYIFQEIGQEPTATYSTCYFYLQHKNLKWSSTHQSIRISRMT